MSLISHILFPVDFSERSLAVVPAVAAYARQFQAQVTLLYALEWAVEGAEEDWSGDALSTLEKRGHERLAAFAPGLLPEGTQRLVRRGKASDVIVSEANGGKADLIMMPSRGHTRFRQLLLGSTTAAVLHDAECAVWTSAHLETIPEHTECHSIVCAVDLREPTVVTLQAAQALAQAWQARLSVVHEVIGVDPRFETAIADRAHAWLVKDARERYPDLARRAGVAVDLEIVENLKLGAGLAEAAEHNQADLMVIGRGAIHGALGRLRSHAHEIIRKSPCPVISI